MRFWQEFNPNKKNKNIKKYRIEFLDVLPRKQLFEVLLMCHLEREWERQGQ